MRPSRDAATDLRAQLYALGQLEADERAAIEVERAGNDDLDLSIAYWDQAFLPMVDIVEPLEPATALWPRIVAATFATQVAAPAGAAKPRRAGVQHDRPSLWERLGFWQFTTFAGAAAALLLALALLLRPPATPAPSAASVAYVAVLEDPNNAEAAGWLVEVTADRSVRLQPLGPRSAGADRVLQFWTKAPDAAGPTSLGIVAGDQPTLVGPDRLASITEGQLFEVTLEPTGGSPLDRPTGPILFKGLAVSMARLQK